MKTIDHFFNSSETVILERDRQSKILQLKKPVYSKKIKQRKHKRIFVSTQFFPLSQKKSNFKNVQNKERAEEIKVRRSKSDLFLHTKNTDFYNENSRNHQNGNLIIQKIEFQADFGNEHLKRNMSSVNCDKIGKSLEKVVYINKNSVINNPYEKIMRTHDNFLKRNDAKIHENKQDQTQINHQLKNVQNRERNSSNKNKIIEHRQKSMEPRQSFKLVQLIRNQNLEGSIINELGQLRKKRNSLGQPANNLQSSKKQSLIRKNSLFLMNFLKQKQKRFGSDKQPHINNIKNLASNIKIQQNPDFRKTFSNKINDKIELMHRTPNKKEEKAKALFNSMKIQPW